MFARSEFEIGRANHHNDGAEQGMTRERPARPQKGEWNDGEFESFLAELAPALENSVGRLGVAGSLGNRTTVVDAEKMILSWPDPSDRIIEELR